MSDKEKATQSLRCAARGRRGVGASEPPRKRKGVDLAVGDAEDQWDATAWESPASKWRLRRATSKDLHGPRGSPTPAKVSKDVRFRPYPGPAAPQCQCGRRASDSRTESVSALGTKTTGPEGSPAGTSACATTHVAAQAGDTEQPGLKARWQAWPPRNNVQVPAQASNEDQPGPEARRQRPTPNKPSRTGKTAYARAEFPRLSVKDHQQRHNFFSSQHPTSHCGLAETACRSRTLLAAEHLGQSES